MNLGLTSTAHAGPASRASCGESPNAAVRLGAEAQALLAGGDIDAYRSLFRSARQLEDPNRCYHAQVVLLERGLAAAASLPSDQGAALLLAVADAAVRVLEAQPSEPIVLNYAAIALYELSSLDAARALYEPWSLDAARALFEAALRLDPSLPNARQNLAAVQSRRRRRPTTRRAHAALPSVARRAKLAAGKAHAATGLTLSLCMIVRDEEQMLARCLAAAAPAVDEIIVVDTGSQDATIEIARSFGAQVIEHQWTDSFAEARNISFDAATGDWLLFLDADEILVAEDAQRLRSLTGHTWREAFYLVETSYTGNAGDGFAVINNALRVFRNRPQYRFEGRIHEQIAHNLPVYAPGRIQQTSVRVEHYGYLGAARDSKGKSQRNVELLRAQAAESPPTPFLHFNLGSEYVAVGDAPSALSEFERAWAMIRAEGSGANYEYAPALVARLVEAMRECGRAEDAASLAADGLRRYPGFTDLVFSQANMAFAIGAYDDACDHYRRCIELGDAPVRYRPTVGCGTYLPRIALAELALKDGDAETARQLLDWCIERYPSLVAVVRPYVTLLLGAGVLPEEAVAEVERRIHPLTSTVRFMLGSALQQAGALQAAERQYRSVVADEPDGAQARLALAETLLCLGDNAGAATQAAAVADDDTHAGLACRIQLSGLISGGELQAASEALVRAPADLSEVEREVFGTWLAIASGAPSPRSLPVAAAPLLGWILETLLRARSFKEFELLLPALEGSELPIRHRRELLGEIYLRHGFLASAAKEWMAVCAEQPDAGALVGLARVATAHDQPHDAAIFATGALELEPDNIDAAEILAHVEPIAATT
jgi:glycosyltransferase involved in cell wall biosynthesis